MKEGQESVRDAGDLSLLSIIFWVPYIPPNKFLFFPFS